MALTKIPRGLLDTGIADSSDATAITIDSSENVTFAGEVTFNDDIGLGMNGASFGTGVPTINFKGTSNSNTRAGALIFKENNNDDVAALYVTDGQDTYGTVLAAYQGDIKFSTATLSGYKMTIKADGNVGIGETSPGSLLHVKASDTGIAPHASAQITLEREGTNYLQFLTAETGTSGILFGDGSDVDVGKIVYDHNIPSMQFMTETATAMTISSNGNVGIGTNSSTEKLNLYAGNSTSGGIETAGNGNTLGSTSMFLGQGSDSAGYLWQRANANMLLGTNNTERMRIDSAGYTLIGRTSASFGATTGIVFRPNNDSYVIVDAAPCLTLRRNSSNGDIMQFYRDGTQVGYISVTASVTSYQSGSDYRLKDNVTYDWKALPRLAQLKPARFNFKVDPDSTVDGFLAHEAQAVVPNAVGGTYNETKDVSNVVLDAKGNVLEEGVTEDNWKAGKEAEEPKYAADTTWKAEHTQDVYQGIDQSKLVPLMVKAIQEQQALIETLQTKVAAL